VPESPRYLLVKGKTEQAEKSLARVLRMCGKKLPEGRLRPLKEKVHLSSAPADLPGAFLGVSGFGVWGGVWVSG